MGHVDRSRDGWTGRTPPDARPEHGPRQAARLSASARCPTATISPSCKELLRTAGVAVVGELVQQREQAAPEPLPRPGQGRRAQGAASRPADANVVAVDDELSPRQERNLEKELGVPVIDRTAVDPRHLRRPRPHRRGQAAGRAGPARVQPRPHARPVDAPRAPRRGGGIGTRGPGESQIETDRRLARDRIAALRRRLEHVKATRARHARRARARAPAARSRSPATPTRASRRCSTR